MRPPHEWESGEGLPLAATPEQLLRGPDRDGKAPAAPVGALIPKGRRHKTLASIAGTMRRRGLSAEEIAVTLIVVNRTRCEQPLEEDEVAELAADIARRYEPAPPDQAQEEIEQEAERVLADGHHARARAKSDQSDQRGALVAFVAKGSAKFEPPELDPVALYGPAGDYARAVQTYTEASPAAVLACVLAAFGNIVGRIPRAEVGGTVHHANEFVLLVGPTSVGRKGEAMGIGRRPFALLDSDWASHAVSRGFGSGESIVEAVRDPRIELDDDGNEQVVDPGARDKRLLVNEEEFGHVLAVAGREGSTLSALIRSAWDGHRLENRTKRATLLATNAHVSLLAGITPTELVTKTTELEAANGLLNRFLIVASRRLQLLPSPPPIPLEFDAEWVEAFAAPLRFVREQAAVLPTLLRDQNAQELWESAYVDELSVERSGLAGAACARAEAHALRLSMLFALLDRTTVIGCEHLEAALELWRYCEASVRLVFGERLGDSDADLILSALAEAGVEGLARTEIRDLFGRHRQGRVASTLGRLVEQGLVVNWKRQTGGRPEQRFRLAQQHERKGETS